MDPNLIDTTGPNPLAMDMLPPPIAEPLQPVLNAAVMRALGQKLATEFTRYENDRKIAEIRYMRNLRQYLGVYDPEIAMRIPADRSNAYPKLTRVKCVSMLSRLMNLLFSGGTKNWGVSASPVPNLEGTELQKIFNKLAAETQGQELTDETIEAAIREVAKVKAKNLETEIADQLTEIGGDRLVDYVALCRKVIMSGIIFGHGVLKGPFAKKRIQRRWTRDEQTGQLTPIEEEILVPQFEFCSVWDYYADMSARYWHQMDGQFERVVMSRQQTKDLTNNEEFFGDVINKYLVDHSEGNYKTKPHEMELKTLGPHQNVNNNDGRKYEALVWDGYVSGHYLKACGVEVQDSQLSDMVQAVVWTLDEQVIRANLNPWAILGEDTINTYHHFVFEEEDASLLGEGLPQIMRDSQLGMCAATRMVLDNSGVVCGQNLVVNRALLEADQDIKSVWPHKVWIRDDDGQAAAFDAVKQIPIESHIAELQAVVNMFREFADVETFVNPATGGDMSKGPSEPFRTATGASMMKGDAALPFKDVVRNYDQFTYSVFSALIAFNKHLNTKPSIKGDFQPTALGSTSLIAKEVLGMAYDSMATTLNPEERIYVDWRGLLKARLEVRDMAVETVMCSDAEAARREQGQAAAQAAQKEQMDKLMSAEVRKLLAEAVKSLTQSDKNTASADAATYGAILSGLEKGVTPAHVAAARGGAGVPDGIEETQTRLNPPPPPKANGAAR